MHHNNKVACTVKVSAITAFSLNTNETKEVVQDIMLNACFYKQDVMSQINIKTNVPLQVKFENLRTLLKEDVLIDTIVVID